MIKFETTFHKVKIKFCLSIKSFVNFGLQSPKRYSGNLIAILHFGDEDLGSLSCNGNLERMSRGIPP